MNLATVISSTIAAAIQKIKVLRFGDADVQEVQSVTLQGIDSNPVKDRIALYAQTGEDGANVIVGYVNKSALAKVGELRLFGSDADGNQVSYTWFRQDGTIEINGDEAHLTRFEDLKAGFDELRTNHNDMVNAWNSFCNAYIPGGPTIVGSPPTIVSLVQTPSTASVDDAKTDTLLTSQD